MSKPKEDNTKKPPQKPEEDLHRPEETIGEAPASDPKPTDRSRVAD